MVLLVGSVIIHTMVHSTYEPPDIVEYSSANKLSEGLDFTVREIHSVPFEVDTVNYTSYWKELAQIQCTGQNNTVLSRMAVGSDNISGDYTEYTEVKNDTISDYRVTLKGSDGKYSLAVWQTEGFSYSVQFTKAVSEQEILIAIQSVK